MTLESPESASAAAEVPPRVVYHVRVRQEGMLDFEKERAALEAQGSSYTRAEWLEDACERVTADSPEEAALAYNRLAYIVEDFEQHPVVEIYDAEGVFVCCIRIGYRSYLYTERVS